MFILSGAVSPTVTASQNNWDPGTDTADVIRATSSGTWNITGMAAKYRGRVLTLVVLSGILVLKNADAASSVGNRFALAGDLYLGPGSAAFLYYDITSTAWRALVAKPSMTAVSQLLGSASSAFGEAVPITLGTNLSMSGTTLNAASAAMTYSTQGANFNAAVNNAYVITANSVTATLPSTGTRGDKIAFYLRSGITSFVVGRNTRKIQNVAEDMTVDMSPTSLTLVFDDTTNGWWLE